MFIVWRITPGFFYSSLPEIPNQERLGFGFYAGQLVVLTEQNIHRYKPRTGKRWRKLSPLGLPADANNFEAILDSKADHLLVRSDAGVHAYRRAALVQTFVSDVLLGAISEGVVVLALESGIEVHQRTVAGGYSYSGSLDWDSSNYMYSLDIDRGRAVSGLEYGVRVFGNLDQTAEHWTAENVSLTLDTDVWFGNSGFGV